MRINLIEDANYNVNVMMGGHNNMPILNETYLSAKTRLKSIKLVHAFYKSIRRVIVSSEEITHLSQLIEQNQMAVLRPWVQMKRNEMGYKIAREVTKQFLKDLQTIRVTKTRMDQIAVPTGAALLRYPLALLSIPSTHDEYLKMVGEDTRRKIRRAEKEGYHFGEFDWNDYLDDIFNINTSKNVRSGGVMHGWYREPVKPRYHNSEEQYFKKYYGIFKDQSLIAYLHLSLCGDFGFFKHIIGHADHLKSGVMYYLLSCAVREYVGHPYVKWFNYGILRAGEKGGTIDFRKHSRFKDYATFFDLENDEELLKYARHVRARGVASV
ncbi:MAG: hypothetical protein ABFD75_00030 [Smithella sp.]